MLIFCRPISVNVIEFYIGCPTRAFPLHFAGLQGLFLDSCSFDGGRFQGWETPVVSAEEVGRVVLHRAGGFSRPEFVFAKDRSA